MVREEISFKIKKVIKETINKEFDDSLLDEEIDIIEKIGINSIDAISILVKIEDEFNIQIEDDALSAELIRTIRNLTEYVKKNIG